jgi:hypothetical protein
MDSVYLDQIINIWFWLFLVFFLYFLYNQFFKSKICVKHALDLLKEHLITLILFYQSNYDESDQVVLIKKWLDSVDVKKIPKEQLDLFKQYVRGL